MARERGIEWLGPPVKTIQHKTRWKCKNGHVWFATYATLYQHKDRDTSGCRQCYEDSMRFTDNDYHNLASENGFIWLGPSVKKNLHKTKWKCKNGHIFISTYSNIQIGNGCIYCRNDNLRLCPGDYYKLAEKRGYKWLGPEVKRTCELTTWECPCGNIWEANYNNISRGRSCPRCKLVINGAQVSVAQVELAKLVKGTLNYKVNNRYIDILVIKSGVKIAIEYDTWYWHGHRIKEDKQRANEIIKNGYKFISIKSNTKLPTVKQINNAIEKLLNGLDYLEIILSDWGKGNLAIDVIK